jgi:hypothetical protein
MASPVIIIEMNVIGIPLLEAVSKWLSGAQLIEQSLCVLQIRCVEAFGKPAVDRSEKLAGFIALALIAPEPRHAHRSAQSETSRLLLPGRRRWR